MYHNNQNTLIHAGKKMWIEIENNNIFFLAGTQIKGHINVVHVGPSFDFSALRLSLRGQEHFHQCGPDYSEVELFEICNIQMPIAQMNPSLSNVQY